mmetsp:Transcript_32262/g.61732  ORF Transcript_32262/g.61732 Transcript_32262/m.61732 type:complete len:100 (-) Transcript_32262:32-331(-)
MLDLNVTEAVEALLGAVSGEHSKGVKESKWRLGTELILECTELGRSLAGLGRGKGGGRSHKGGESSKLHHVSEIDYFFLRLLQKEIVSKSGGSQCMDEN